MRTIDLNIAPVLRLIAAVAGVLGLTAWSASAQTHTVRLVAAPLTKSVTLPNGTQLAVPMWGFALDAELDPNGNGILDPGEELNDLNGNGQLDGQQPPTVPGPRITVPPGVTTLQIELRNALTDPGAEPVSIVIPGQALPTGAGGVSHAPVRTGAGRIFSMTAEAAPGGSQTYVFNNVKPGTFLYQSGSHQAVQVQMGLYGAMTQDAAAGEAYTGVPYASEVLLLYSEIDIALHDAVASGIYGRADLGGPTSTVNYKPTLFLVNGDSYANDATAAIDAGIEGQRTLIRLLNAGLRTHAPVLENGLLTLVAEDGNAAPYAQARAAVNLAAGKTHDAIWTPAAAGVFPIYDRMLSLNADGSSAEAGMLAKLRVAPVAGSTGPLVALPDSYDGVMHPAVTEDELYVIPNTLDDAANWGVLANDTGATSAVLVTRPRSAAAFAFRVNGTFQYRAAVNFFGVDSFTYQAVRNVAGVITRSEPISVTIKVNPVADPPRGLAQQVGVDFRGQIPIALQGSDPDGDPITFYITALPPPRAGTLSIIDPITNIERVLTDADRRSATLGQAGTPIPGGNLLFTAAPAAGLLPLPQPYTRAFQFIVFDGATEDVSARNVSVAVHALPAALTLTGNTLNLSVVGADGTPISNFKWTVEEDRMYPVVPGVPDPNTLAVSFHASYMPVTQTGDQSTRPIVDPAKRYFVSVLPSDGGYSNSGAPIAPGQTSATIVVNKGPQPTAQIRVRVFLDNAPLNGVWDPEESGLSGFQVAIDDAGGRYGMSGGQAMFDAFGNHIGTTYACPQAPAPCDGLQVVQLGQGFVLTDDQGYALIKNLAPGKYAVKVRAPGGPWQQTSTLEGTRAIDAWVKANEPQYFTEFGPPGPHAEVGFVQKTNDASVLGAGPGPFSTISGDITNLHMSRPPDATMFSGAPFDFTRPWVALNTGAIGGTMIYAGPTDENGHFEIAGVPTGSYQLWVFDSALNIIISSKVLNVTGGTDVALGPVPVFHWFTRQHHYVFEDLNENGIRDNGEVGIPEQAVNLRWRDGSMYMSSATDGSGFVPFEEVFPFFAWQIAEVDYTRFKATGVTVVVDNGGNPFVDTSWPTQVGAETDPAVLAPQPQSENGGAAYRTETGPVLLEAFQGFIGQTSVMLWGKAPYAPSASIVTDVNVAPFNDYIDANANGIQDADEPTYFPGPGDTDANANGAFDVDQFHGGVSGIVHYSTTRAENDPRWGTGEPWEPGIPGVRVQLWNAGRTQLLNEATTDSWDDSQPTNCQGTPFIYIVAGVQYPKDCYDGLRNWNQVRPGVFDGGYAFFTQLEPTNVPLDQRTTERPLPAGKYVVKVIAPDGYTLVKEEDKNVDFGDEYIPQEFYLNGYALADAGVGDAQPGVTVEEYPLVAPFCVGSLHEVPQTLALFPGVVNTTYAGDKRPLCDSKLVTVRNGGNGAANFFLYTAAPIAGHIVGFVLDDTTNESDPNSPQFGEKYAPPFMPVSVRDWTGREIARTSTDQFGRYNVLVPSTYTANAPEPSGMSPNMLTACINAPLYADGTPDPNFHKTYSHFCYTFQYMPGTTTYLDTPVLPTGAFTGSDAFPVDAELPSLTPMIARVTSLYQPSGAAIAPVTVGPYLVDRGPGGPTSDNGRLRTIEIVSAGSNVQVINPLYDGAAGTQPKLITRDYGFGSGTSNGVVRLGGRPIRITSWTNDRIEAVVPTNWQNVMGTPLPVGTNFRTGELTVERCLTGNKLQDTNQCPGDSRTSVVGVTLHVATPQMHQARPPVVLAAGQSIQSAIDAARPGDLILVAPGTYNEMTVMSKPVRLQGWGANSTTINTVQVPAENIQAWRDKVGALIAANQDYLLPDQLNILGPPPYLEGAIRAATGGEGAGVMVLGKNQARGAGGECLGTTADPANEAYCLMDEELLDGVAVLRSNARIDGFSIMGSSQDAGISVNAYARFLGISNNKIFNNYGFLAGGVRLGHPGATLGLADENAGNFDITIRHNMITQNAGFDVGGGVVIGTGSNRYEVSENWIAANFSGGWGGGITHRGLSPGGLIDRNTIIFNESFNQGVPTSGGGIFVGGRAPVVGALTPGSGSVTISDNLIQGNQAAGGDGGGIALHGVNGIDVQQLAPAARYRVRLYNNMIVNNVAGLAGGGISLQDAAYVEIVHNTVAHNDSTATAGAAFATPTTSTAQPAGIVSRGHTPLLSQALGAGFSDPTLYNSTIWENRSFYFGVTGTGSQVPGDPNPVPTRYGLIPNASGPYWDLGVLGAPAGSALTPQFSQVTGSGVAPDFAASYFNGARAVILVPDVAGIIVPVAFDEGGNFIRPQFGPLSLTGSATAPGGFWGNYHVNAGVVGGGLAPLYGSPAAVPIALRTDFDNQARDLASAHIGADQKTAAPTPVTPIP
ncbi:MAG TPA: hypothetical protein VK886_19075 [Vicinamibacterales bacterium]|nr:hypothetical protein [Vicinamibacterales bacterium]